MATNPVVKLRRGAYSSLTSYPIIDGQLFLATSTNAYLTSALARTDTTGYNVFAVDIASSDGTSVQRVTLDAYRAIYASEAATAVTASTWTSTVPFRITDGTHNGTSVAVDGSAEIYSLPLPSTISASIIGNVTGTADNAHALTNAQGTAYSVGSSSGPVYFSNGVPVACGNSLDVSISGNANTSSAWSSTATFWVADYYGNKGQAVAVDGSSSDGYTLKLPETIKATLNGKASSADKLNSNAGSATQPVYFANGVPVACGGSLAVDITGNAGSATVASALSAGAGSANVPVYIDSTGVPTAVTGLDATKLTGTIPIACIPVGAQERMILKTDQTAIKAMTVDDAQEGDVIKDVDSGKMYYVVAPTTTGIAFKNNAQTLGFMEFSAGSASHASTADTANALSGSPTIALSGAVTGAATIFDGTQGITISTSNIDLTYVNNGTLGVGNGGTGKASWTPYAIVYASAANELSQLGTGASSQVLQSGGSGAAPSWVDASSLSVGYAAQLASAVNINGTAFDGSDSITTARWGESRNISIASSDGTGAGNAVSVNGSQAVTLLLPSTIKANLTGKADTAGTADGLAHSLYYQVTAVTGGYTHDNEEYGNPSATQNTTFSLEPDDLFPSYYTDFSETLTGGSWATITTPANMSTGSYIVQIKSTGGTKFVNEFFTGTMSYSNATCEASQTDSDEVMLHAAGKGLGNNRIYLRTRRQSNGKIIIEFTATTNLTTSDTFRITFRRMI